MGAGVNSISEDAEEAAFVQLGEEKTSKKYITYISAGAEKTDKESSQRRKIKIHRGMGIGSKSRWNEEVQPSPISWFLYCEMPMVVNAKEDSSFQH